MRIRDATDRGGDSRSNYLPPAGPGSMTCQILVKYWSNIGQISPQMSSGPPSKPLMSQNPSLRGPLLACSRRATDDCNRRRPPSAHAHAPTECSSVPRSSHLCHAPTPPQIPPVTTPSSPSSTAPSTQVPSRSNPCQSVSNPRPALGPWSIRAKVPRRTGPPVNASKSVKIRQISDPARAPTIPPTSSYTCTTKPFRHRAFE